MVAFTDSIEYARRLLPAAKYWERCSIAELEPEVGSLLTCLQPDAEWLRSDYVAAAARRVVLVEMAPDSQFDRLRSAAGNEMLPRGDTCCLAGSGVSFHGHRGRGWVALPGNLHVSVALAPCRSIPHLGAVCMALPAVATARAIEAIMPAAKAVGIKWVNDVVIENSKVAGVIAHTRATGDRVDQVILGIGLNVEATPELHRCPFVPRAGSLREHDRRVTQAEVLSCLLDHLREEYQALLSQGPQPLLSAYRERSIVIGKQVELHPDGTTAVAPIAGRVSGIGDDLELILEGRSAPVARGRLRFCPPE